MRAFHCHELSPTFKNKRCLFSSFEMLTGRLVANPKRLGKAQNLEFGTHLTSTCFFQSLNWFIWVLPEISMLMGNKLWSSKSEPEINPLIQLKPKVCLPSSWTPWSFWLSSMPLNRPPLASPRWELVGYAMPAIRNFHDQKLAHGEWEWTMKKNMINHEIN
jgi:hypothetical protein